MYKLKEFVSLKDLKKMSPEVQKRLEKLKDLKNRKVDPKVNKPNNPISTMGIRG